jgi:acetate kinase
VKSVPTPSTALDAILTLNAGSSSIKFALFGLPVDNGPMPEQAAFVGQIDGLGAKPRLKVKNSIGQVLTDVELDLPKEGGHQAGLQHLLGWLDEHDQDWKIVAVGHRVVHGGERFSAPLKLDKESIAFLGELISLAPLHQPHNLGGVNAIAALLPEMPQVACFDTAFHRTNPAVAQAFALPRRLTDKGIKRYGFHGLSYEYVAQQLPALLGERARGRVVVAHLGNGSSACAIQDGKSQASSMGFTAIDGLMMGTRCGTLDAGVVLHLVQQERMDISDICNMLYKESGLLGVSGISQDMRTLLSSEEAAAKEAIELYVYRLVREIGSLSAAIGGLDALVFTGGIGENAAPIRAAVCRQLAWMGLHLDEPLNAEGGVRGRTISHPDSQVRCLVVPTNEEWMIAQHSRDLLGL